MLSTGVSAAPSLPSARVHARLARAKGNVVVVGMAEELFQTDLLAPLNPLRDYIFPCIAGSELSMGSTLYYSLICTGFYKREIMPSRVLESKGRAFSLIQKALRDPKAAFSTDNCYAVALVVLSACRNGDKAEFQAHLNGLGTLLRQRGGMESFEGNPAMCAAMTWTEITMEKFMLGSSIVRPFRYAIHEEATAAATEALCEIEDVCSVLTELQLSAQEELSIRAENSPAYQARRELFERGTLIHSLLTPEERSNPAATGVGQFMSNCQLSCLFYLTYKLNRYRHEPEKTIAFVHRVSTLLTEHSIGGKRRAQLLVWVFMQECLLHDIKTLWWMVRAARFVRRLSADTVYHLQHALVDSLVAPDVPRSPGEKWLKFGIETLNIPPIRDEAILSIDFGRLKLDPD